MHSSERILITGGNGFIGSHLARRCVALGFRVAVFSHHTANNWRLADIEDKIEIYTGSVMDQEIVASLINKFKPEIIFHLATSINRDRSMKVFNDLYQINVRGTEVLITSLLGKDHLKCFVQMGTIDEYGGNRAPFKEEDRELPMSPYSLTKLMANRMIEYVIRMQKFPGVIMRPSLVYGPAQNFGMLVTDCIKSCLVGETLPMTRGEQSRDLLYIDDLVNALIKVADCKEAIGEIINLGNGKELMIKDIVLEINTLLGDRGIFNFGQLSYRPGENMHFCLDTNKARRILRWKPQTSLSEGLRVTVEWYKNNQVFFQFLQPQR